MVAHIELIKPTEKLSPDLGGTGYLPPSRPATLKELAEACAKGQVIWKVDRSTVNWKKAAKTRILDLGEHSELGRVRVRCVILGGTGCPSKGWAGYWYFVRVL